MTTTAKLDVNNQDILLTLREFLQSVLEQDEISAILAPQRLPMKNVVMPVLITDPEQLNRADPLAPYFPLNAARLVTRLTRKPSGGKVAVVLRSCEIRAFIELVKLNQGQTDDIIIIGTDCLGAYSNTDYLKKAGDDPDAFTRRFCENALNSPNESVDDAELIPACRACEHPIPDGADLLIGLLGIDTSKQLLVRAQTLAGEELLVKLDLPTFEEPDARQKVVDALIKKRIDYRDRMFAATHEATDSLEKMTTYLAGCINCYNCRIACPVCYCKECVFVTDVFYHEPFQYLQWARNKGALKMPTDTVFYHLTRLAHISTACVGCGQCTNACPNDIPVMELFRMVSHRTQQAFDYEAGRNIEEEPPLSVFREDEFKDIVGI